ncbi:MAG: leucine-rich repeat protein [Ruminococcus sp.]|nr:leucine-rich repeat protein [Ruminococcus sp.]
MKRIICLSMCLILAISCVFSAGAADTVAESGKTLVTYDDWVYERISGDRYWEIDSYIGQDTELIIPRIVNDVMVVSLSNYCFSGNTAITSVETSSPLWNIGEYAFSGCTSLESVELNFALQTIGVGAFTGTTSLKNINLEDSAVTEINAHAFMNSGIEEVTLPDTCEKIGNYAFGQCSSLSKITIPKSVTEIHQDAFKSSENAVIYCYTDSYAHQYAEANDIEYVLIDAPVEYTFILGDADHDGIVSILDATTIQKYLASIISDDDGWIRMAGSVEGEKLNIMDATYIQKYLACFGVPYEIGKEVTRLI